MQDTTHKPKEFSSASVDSEGANTRADRLGLTLRQQAKARNEAWRLALSEGRVLRFDDGLRLISYPTDDARDKAFVEAKNAGHQVECVTVPNMNTDSNTVG